MRRCSGLLLTCFAAVTRPLAAQWSVAVEVGSAAFTGSSTDTSTMHSSASLRPYHATTLLVRLERQWGRAGLGVGVLYGSPGVAVETADIVALEKGVLTVREIAPELAVLLAHSTSGVALRAHAGAIIDFWSPKGAGRRTRAGAQAGLSLACPLGSRVSGLVRAGVALMGSVFEEGEQPSGFALRPTWRRSLAGGVRWRL